MTPDGRRAVSGSFDRTLKVWDLEQAANSLSLRAHAQFPCCTVTPDGRFAVAGDGAGQMHVLEILL